jgi:hypothetical protein
MALLDSNRVAAINTGTSANDGTGDTLRQAATKINANFYRIDSDLTGLTFGQIVDKQRNHDSVNSGKLDLIDLGLETTSRVLFNNAFDSVEHLNTVLDAADSFSTFTGSFIYLRNHGRFAASDSSKWDRLILDSDTFSLETFPKFTAAFEDDDGNEILQLSNGMSQAVNYVKINNDSDPVISAVGDSDNINLILVGKGTGEVSIDGDFSVGTNATVTGRLTVLDSSTLTKITVTDATFLNNVTIESDLTVTDELRINGYGVVTPETLVISDAATNDDSATYTLRNANIARFEHDSDLTIKLVGTGGGSLDGMSFSILVKNTTDATSMNITLASDSATVHHAIGNPVNLAAGKFSIIGGIVFDSANILISNANTV